MPCLKLSFTYFTTSKNYFGHALIKMAYKRTNCWADNPHCNIPLTKPVREAKAQLWVVAPLMMMMIKGQNCHNLY
jgi:hypothetical protein